MYCEECFMVSDPLTFYAEAVLILHLPLPCPLVMLLPGAVGSVLLYFAAILYWVEARRETKNSDFGFSSPPVAYEHSSQV